MKTTIKLTPIKLTGVAKAVWEMVQADPLAKTYSTPESVEDFVKNSRLRGVSQNYWGLRAACLRRQEFDECQKRKLEGEAEHRRIFKDDIMREISAFELDGGR